MQIKTTVGDITYLNTGENTENLDHPYTAGRDVE